MTRKLGKLVAAAGALALALSMSACSQERGGTSGGGTETKGGTEATAGSSCDFDASGTIGVAMPTKSLERWNRDGAHLKENLEGMGFTVDLQYADNKPEVQISQIENMVNAGVEVLVVASIDGEALDPVLTTAKEAGIPVIAYDRLILNTDSIDYYATFDNYKVGQMQGEYIEEALDLANTTETFTFEPFSGSPDDNNARFFFAGAWDVLSPYVDSGTLVVKSGKAPASLDDWQSIGILGWDGSKAQAEMETRLNSFYRDDKVDVVLSPNDSLALGITQALLDDGYTTDDFPVLTGQDADLANAQNIVKGLQTMTVWKDTRALGDQVATMVQQIATCKTVDVNDTETYDNGNFVVPSYLLDPTVITSDNIIEQLVGSGFYTEEDLQG